MPLKFFVIVTANAPFVCILYLVVCQALHFRHGIITGEPQKCFRFFGKQKGDKNLKRSKNLKKKRKKKKKK